MGGKALKHITTRRYQKDEYLALRDRVLKALHEYPLLSGKRIKDIQAYSEKESFGDLDVMVESDQLDYTFWDGIKELFQPDEFVRNGPVTSFNVDELQVDLILMPASNFETALTYFAFNDLGNLMGRVAYKLGFKYGHEGLSYVYRDNNENPISVIPLTKDPRQTFEFLNYSYDRWLNGFNNLVEIYQYTASSQYFNAEYYDLATRSYKARVRDAKRSTYSGFLDWVATAENLPCYTGSHAEQLQRALDTFPAFAAELAQAKMNHEHEQVYRQKFNGEVVKALTGLDGQLLGQWIEGFRKQWSNSNDFFTWVVQSSQADIDARIMADRLRITLVEKTISLFNRDNVREWTGLSGSDLKQFMTMFRQQWPAESDYQTWLDLQTIESLSLVVKEQLGKLKSPTYSMESPSLT